MGNNQQKGWFTTSSKASKGKRVAMAHRIRLSAKYWDMVAPQTQLSQTPGKQHLSWSPSSYWSSQFATIRKITNSLIHCFPFFFSCVTKSLRATSDQKKIWGSVHFLFFYSGTETARTKIYIAPPEITGQLELPIWFANRKCHRDACFPSRVDENQARQDKLYCPAETTTHTDRGMHTHTGTRTHTRAHTCKHTHGHTHAHTHGHTHARTHMGTHAHTHGHTQGQTRTHTRAHSRTHTGAHTRAHTWAHMHTYAWNTCVKQPNV